ncbi:MAG: 1,4-alpha-glucan branching protein GlgB [Clostridia bacterium]
MDIQNFYRGFSFDSYEYLGCHLEYNGAVFRTFAPNAKSIAVIGEFNMWQETKMHKIHDGNFWEVFIENAKEGDMYKYRIEGRDGRIIDHCDPYGYGMELRPNNASIIRDMKKYTFNDEEWMKNRTDCRNKPLNIYEMHLGSWKSNAHDENGWYNCRDLCDTLIPYLKEYGYNYIEIMPIAEHPCDNSWGYQITGFYSPTSRYGTCDDLKAFVDKCHQEGIGVILDFVPVHFATDDYALERYDGTPLFEYPHPDVGYSEWSSHNFNHSRGEVQSFLQSNANYFLTEYHFDGLRVDAISRIIYWQGDENRGVNSDGVRFLKQMNYSLKNMHQGIILAAEDSTAFPAVTAPADSGGLGFDYKWDMGWMNDTLEYFKIDPYFRSGNYHKLTFSMMYFYNENYLLPLSHDENVHGKATIAQKMYGDYDLKFPQARAMYLYMYAHPGKKLNFMGNEIAQLREWDEKREQDWDMLKYPNHDAFHRFIRDINLTYLSSHSLWEKDFSRDGFNWVECGAENKCSYAFRRIAEGEQTLAVFNFSGCEQTLSLNIDCKKLQLLIATDRDIYGGETNYSTKPIKVKSGLFTITLPPFGAHLYMEL